MFQKNWKLEQSFPRQHAKENLDLLPPQLVEQTLGQHQKNKVNLIFLIFSIYLK